MRIESVALPRVGSKEVVMKRMWMLGVLALVVAAVAATPAGAASDGFAVGGGSTGTLHFGFSARLGPHGPSGYAVVKDPTLGEAQGHVVCYRGTSPHQTVFFIETEKGSGLLGSRPFLGLFAADFTPFSVADFFFVSPAFATGSCVLDSGPGGPVSQGNIVVK